tara:strand:+ start:288 stop:1430 length:1143 start_codon:yes stop_codon:yes gene_type:complete
MRKLKIARLINVQTDIILFDDVKTEYIESIALENFKYQKIYVDIFKSFSRRIVFSIPSILRSIYYFLFRYDKKISWKINLILAYYYGVINTIAPKVIITYQGTPKHFFSLLTSISRNINILALSLSPLRDRNIRDMEPSIARNPELAHYYVWGENDKKDLVSIGQLEKNIHVIGSMLSGIHNLTHKGENSTEKYDICIISTIQEVEDKEGEKNEDILLKFTFDYLTSNPNLRICIASRQTVEKGKKRERNFYSGRLRGIQLDFIESDVDNLSSYKAISSSKIVIAQNSSLGLEAMGWGHKVLFCQPNKLSFWTPDDLTYSVIDYNQDRFNSLLGELFEIPVSQYREKIKNNATKYCYFDKINPPHLVIQNKLNELLLELK